MLIDLHTHTSPCSGCSRVTARELIEEAQRQRLDAICVTDHLFAWGGREAQRLAQAEYKLQVFWGIEARTTLGDVLVFGLDEDIPEGVDGAELLRRVDQEGGASILAHPFHRGGGWALWYWMEEQGLALTGDLALRPELEHLHAIETFNGAVTPSELRQAEDLARILGLPATGGSDAHAAYHVGRTVTEFARPIEDEADLVREIRARRIRPRRLR